MRKKILWLIPGLIILLACTCSVPSIIPALKTPATGTSSASSGFVTARLHPVGGSLIKQLSSEIQKAAGQGLKPFVEFDATW
jgi:hypothetical protein